MNTFIEESLAAFNDYSPDSRVWIYQADKILGDGEVDTIEKEVKTFVSSWAAHGKPLEAGFAILFNTFVILVVDEQKEKASGCSIDSSVKVFKELGKTLKIDFFNRFAITYIQDEEFNCVTKEQFETLVNKNTSNLWVFDNTQTKLSSLYKNWLVPFENSWQKNYFLSENTFKLSL